MLTIRLSRIGKKKQPQYRLVLQEAQHDPWSPAKEILGHYNPRSEKDQTVLHIERIQYWLSQGAKPSATVHNMLVNAGVIKAEKMNTVTISKERAKKMEDQKAAEEQKKREAEEAAKAAKEAEAAKAAEEAAAAQAPAEAAVAETPATETPAA
jgi:small subunit ribosomal protein S16